MRVVIALGGNAMTGEDGRAGPEDQRIAVEAAMEDVADLVASGVEVVLTHGNGPQVGNLLVKNELAAARRPAGAAGLVRRADPGHDRHADPERARRGARRARRPRASGGRGHAHARRRGRPGFTNPTKPIGRYLPEAEAARLIEHGEMWEDRGEKGWRRVVASPEPIEVLDAPAIQRCSTPASSWSAPAAAGSRWSPDRTASSTGSAR